MENAADVLRLPLRQRKLAAVKLALLDEALRRMVTSPLEDIRVRDICEAVEISEATFFNHFPRKTDLLLYFIQLWSLEMSWHAERVAQRLGGLKAIEEVFAMTARRVRERPNVMAEIISFQARMREPPKLGEVSMAERMLRFPDLLGMESVKSRSIEEVLAPLVDQAVKAGDIPPGTERTALVTALATVFFGAPSIFRCRQGRGVGAAYKAHLRFLWKSLGASG